MAEYVKFSVPKELAERCLGLVEKARKGGKLRIGSNEVTKAIERQKAKLVVMAEDVSPPEIMMHLPLLCAEKNVPFGFVPTRKELGEKSGIGVSTTAVAIAEEGDAKKELDDVVKKLSELRK
ncbi:MAG TPA: 50S ribosomal protein L7ae [Candidatus Diapherotrites archaeon]|uniref:Large ribosomal subunit protein eL8 n=1 Tax=Candidatus Iainarchaeum sp. TaxID=3101447 RepID=A0A7J4JF21_9ARCH|nr:50S ribosomal protein L7Ae [Candidatus Diapherotrites archaeon]HIH16371.1 50S ribosomal protein L7ae [Candidatus Diapherotrites archaeon]